MSAFLQSDIQDCQKINKLTAGVQVRATKQNIEVTSRWYSIEKPKIG